MGAYISAPVTRLQHAAILDSGDTPHRNEHITMQNNITSGFHKLPTELLLEIDGYLGPEPSPYRYSAAVPQMALRATCRRFRAILSGPPGPWHRWSRWDRKAYSNLLQLAEFRALCASERGGQLDGEGNGGERPRRVCCICRASHLDDRFTPVEQKKEPEKRMCIGSQGVLQICPHNRVTYAGLRMKPIRITCNNKHYAWTGDGNRAGPPTTVKVCEVEEQGKHEAKIEVLLGLGAVEMGTKVQMNRILEPLKKADWRICPHLHTRAMEPLLPFLLGDSQLLRLPPAGTLCGLLFSKFSGRTSWPVYTCEALNCDTRLTLGFRRESGTKNGASLYLKIERFLGEFTTGADDEKWLAQLTEASQLEEDRFLTVMGNTERRDRRKQEERASAPRMMDEDMGPRGETSREEWVWVAGNDGS